MQVSGSLHIDAPTKKLWEVITDIHGCEERISGIIHAEVLEEGAPLVGLKWKETRKFAGKEATETMWITDAVEGQWYETRAESHGAIYKSTMAVEPDGSGSKLTMSFDGQAVTFGAKVMWALTGWMAKKPLMKSIMDDLEDIKAACE
ncbi:MAG: SRPBCC family protein [Thermoplasmatota archaeon]